MNNELLMLRGRLATAEQLIPTMASGIDIDIDELRTMLDRYTSKPELRDDRIAIVSKRLCESIVKFREVTALIASIKKDLGE